MRHPRHDGVRIITVRMWFIVLKHRTRYRGRETFFFHVPIGRALLRIIFVTKIIGVKLKVCMHNSRKCVRIVSVIVAKLFVWTLQIVSHRSTRLDHRLYTRVSVVLIRQTANDSERAKKRTGICYYARYVTVPVKAPRRAPRGIYIFTLEPFRSKPVTRTTQSIIDRFTTDGVNVIPPRTATARRHAGSIRRVQLGRQRINRLLWQTRWK